MEKYVIKGGNVLEGEVSIAGAKNAALGILAAAVMTDEECIIENVPYVEDTKTLLRAIETIGAKVKYIDNHTVSICVVPDHRSQNPGCHGQTMACVRSRSRCRTQPDLTAPSHAPGQST